MAKGKCINIGKPCDLAISEEIQEADEANFVCKSCGKPLVAVTEIEGGDKGAGGGSMKGLVIGLCCAGAAALGIGGWFMLKPAGEEAQAPEKEPVEVIEEQPQAVGETVVEAVEETAGEAVAEEPAVAGPADQTPANPNYLKGYSLGWGSYEGPAVDGKPDGPGGTVKVTKAHSIDLKAGGEMLDVVPGDVIVNAKFRNGKLIQGFLKRKQGEGKNFNIGI